MSMPWIHPWTSILSGPTGCGKTFFVKKFLNNLMRMSDTRFERVILYYSEWQPAYRELGSSLEFREGLPQTSDFADDPRPKLVIIDDLMRQSSASGALCDLFTKNSHHNNLSVIFITQNIFHQGRGQRDVSLNSHYIVLFRNVRDRAQIRHLARQVYPEDPRFLQEAYSDATSQAYGYLLLDLKQTTPDNCRFRTAIFPDDAYHYVYESVERLGGGGGSDIVIVKQKKSVQTPGTPLERLDAEMNEILLAPCSDERAKWNRYNSVLQRYLQLAKSSRHIPEKPKTEERTDADDASDTSKDDATATSSAPIDTLIVESVPAKYRRNAKNLVEWLRRDASIQWSENGSVNIDGSSIEGNIIDFVNDAMRSRSGSPPRGISQFIEALRKASVPREFIGNKQYQRFVVSQSRTSEDDSPAESSTSPNSSPLTGGRNHKQKRKRKINSPEIVPTPVNNKNTRSRLPSITNNRKWLRMTERH
ncbi:unnamed protein product [Trichogramma brassicae]|uniref:AAA+ ATPase domain-containing protein n=1 Tax=Trichogramma brassicae TaxID=86971 RepID=A0A6H5IUF5_9HYME|nr:unnamed protein product [Trichogramma brassicae]